MRSLVDIIYPFYSNYCDSHELLDYSSLFRFFKDFKIFPEIINLLQFKTIFYSLNDLLLEQINSNSELFDKYIAKEIKNNCKINFNAFMDSLLLASTYIQSNDNMTNIERMLYLFDKMAQANPLNKSNSRSAKY